MEKDYYKILNVEKNSTNEEIKKAYKKLAKKYHPDISKEDNAEEEFKKINEAASILLDAEKRKNYDAYGSETGPSGFNNGSGFSGFSSSGFNPQDFGINIEDLFGQFGFGGGNGFSNFSKKDYEEESDIEVRIHISLKEAFEGIEKKIKISRNDKCNNCKGSGAKNNSSKKTCNVCGGMGVVTEIQRTFFGNLKTQKTCSKCNGTGKIIIEKCEICFGKGSLNIKEEISIPIPKGIKTGNSLRISKKGNYNSEHDIYSDLYIKIDIDKDKAFEVEEEDLYKDLDINFISAILGDEIEFDYFNKTLSLKIPAGTQSFDILRLKGKGMPYLNSNSNGDLYIKINISIPKKTTKEQKNLLIQYAKTLKDENIFSRLKHFF